MRALLQDAAGSVAWLVESMRLFGDQLGTVLYRVPADVKRNDEALAALIAAWPRDVPLTMEFQDPSWLIDEVLDPLRAFGAAVCATDLDENAEPPSLHLTASFLYVRLRRTSYSEADLATWAARLAPFLDAGHDVFAFFKHDDVGNATRYAHGLMKATHRILREANAPA